MQFTRKKIANNNAILYEDAGIEEGYYYGLFFDKNSVRTEILGNAVYLNKKLINLDDYKQSFELSFADCNGCSYDGLIFPRKKLNKKEVLELADYGVMVDELKAQYLIHTILNQEQEENLTIEYIHKKLGFKEVDEKIVFLGDKGYNVSSSYHGDLEIQSCGKYEVWRKMIEEEVVGHTPMEVIFSVLWIFHL